MHNQFLMCRILTIFDENNMQSGVLDFSLPTVLTYSLMIFVYVLLPLIMTKKKLKLARTNHTFSFECGFSLNSSRNWIKQSTL